VRNWLYPTAERMASTKLLTLYFAAAVIALVAWILNVGQLYWMSGALALLPTCSRVVAALEQRGIEVQRDLPYAGHQGEEILAHLSVQNLTPLPKLHVSVRDVLPVGLTAVPPDPIPVHLAPRGHESADYRIRLGRRGLHSLASVGILTTDPLGLAHEETARTLPARILVYPRVVELPEEFLAPEARGGGAAVETSSRQGEGTGFFGIRQYRPGDPLRHIHWRTAARVGRLAVIEWEADESRDTLIAVETGAGTERSLGSGSTLDLAAGLAASLASSLLTRNHALRVVAPGYSRWKPVADRGTTAIPDILEVLALMQADHAASVGTEIRRLSPHLNPGAQVCLITPAADEALAETCRYLLTARLSPVVYALLDTPRGRPTEWEALSLELGALGVPVIRLHPDDELTTRLLS
jgi:uncharacterized protein (DUF58 family)